MQKRLDILKIEIGFEAADGILLTSPVNRFWVSGFKSSAGAIVITKDSAHYIADSRYIEAVTKNVPNMTPVKMGATVEGTVAELVEKLGIKKLAFEDNRLTVSSLTAFSKAMPNVEFIPLENSVELLRAVKDEGEVELVKIAQGITERAFTKLLTEIKVGMTEIQLARRLECLMLEEGADGFAFSTICASGENSSMPHAVPSDRKIKEGDFITFDFGAAYKNYRCDMTRTIAVGSVTEEMEKVYNTVLKAQVAAIEASKAGVIGCEIDKIARDIITEAGYGNNFGHGLGHSFGIEIHEDPRFSIPCKTAIPENCLITVEPGIYLEGKFGVRIEDDILITKDGHINLTTMPKDLTIIKV